MPKSKRAKACDISAKVKDIVWERDGHRCVICGNHVNVMPNAHYISRAHGGLGIPENVVTLCTNLTPNMCHHYFDNGTREDRQRIGAKIEAHLRGHYADWDVEQLVYRKG